MTFPGSSGNYFFKDFYFLYENNDFKKFFQYNLIMQRNFSCEATVLLIHQSGENNRTVTFFSKEDGIFYATLFGGPKSKLRSLVSPFNSGTLFYYKNETKNISKITDFDVKSCHLSFRESLFKTYAATLASEIILKTKCAGSSKKAFSLFNALLDGMDFFDDAESEKGLLRFLWRYIELSGVKPEVRFCCQCGTDFLSNRFTAENISYKALYSPLQKSLICQNCLFPNQNGLFLSVESITYLEAITNLPPKTVRSINISQNAIKELKDFCYTLIEIICNQKLLTFQTGNGIL